jgi:hypothetical protein
MTLASKIAAASLKVGGVLSTDKINKEQNYPYLSADKIIAICGQALAEQGIAVMPEITTWHVEAVAYTSSRGGQGTRHDAAVAFLMKITDGDEKAESPWLGMGSDYAVPDKAVYKAITSGHRYYLAKLLNVGAGNEDGEHETGDGDGEGRSEKKVSTTKLPIAGPVPNCPKCGGPMWDNRDKIASSGKRMPEFSCKAGRWDSVTKTTIGCDGAIWPQKDTSADRQEAAGRQVPTDEPPPDPPEWDALQSAPPAGEGSAPTIISQIERKPAKQAANTWIDDQAMRANWFAWLKDQNVNQEQALAILNIERFHDFAGTLGGAKTIVTQWKKQNG